MSSPFPGMDPYLERHWGDVHQAFITYARDQLQERLPEGLRARMQERVYIEDQDVPTAYYPDVAVLERAGRERGPEAPAGRAGVAMVEPLIVPLPTGPARVGYIEITEIKPERLVTTIEVLSPSNKLPGKGRRMFVRKQRELRARRVNTVEIDLLRDGKSVLMVPPEHLDPLERATYQACVWRAWRPLQVEVYRLLLRERLPVIPVPLRPKDTDVPLDLQAILDQCYRNGGYEDIDYRAAPEPPLAPEEAAWADALLRAGPAVT